MRSFSTDKSNRISAMEYYPESETLKVTFKRGGVYEYYGVPEDVYDGLIIDPSLGKAFDSSIKGIYNFSRLV